MARDSFQFLSCSVVAMSCTPRSKKWIMSAPWKATRLDFDWFSVDLTCKSIQGIISRSCLLLLSGSWQASVELTSPYTGKVVKVHHKVDVDGCTFDLYLLMSAFAYRMSCHDSRITHSLLSFHGYPLQDSGRIPPERDISLISVTLVNLQGSRS